MPILPPRPYRVASRYVFRRSLGGFALVALGLAIFLGSGWWLMGQAQKIRSDEALWATGQLADRVHVSGKETSHNFLLNDYDLQVEFHVGQEVHGGKVAFTLFGSSVDKNERASLKYDPADPSRYVLSWAVEHAGARWGAWIFLVSTLTLLMGLGCAALGLRNLREVGDTRRVAERSDEHALELVEAKPIMYKGRHVRTVYTVKYGTRPKPLRLPLPATEQPLFTNGKRTHLVALVSAHAPERPYLVRAALAPFELSPEAIAELRTKIAAS